VAPDDKTDAASREREQPLTERAAVAARAELRGERGGILGAVAGGDFLRPLARTRRPPERWSLLRAWAHFQ
jgi:hypothetical protein